ncbi:MAG: peptidylprolyl isomerase [Patescibacteria group bacterium]
MTTPTPSSDIKKPTGIILHTTSGDIEIAFFTDKAPKTVENFVTLSKNNFYNDTKFHRVIKGFMIQGGDPLSKGDDKTLYGRGGPGYAFADEFNDEKLVRGVLAMANSGPNTNGSQFFIVTAASTPWLDGKHTAFGKVVKGMDIVDRIENVRTGQNDIPETAIVVKSVEIR